MMICQSWGGGGVVVSSTLHFFLSARTVSYHLTDVISHKNNIHNVHNKLYLYETMVILGQKSFEIIVGKERNTS